MHTTSYTKDISDLGPTTTSFVYNGDLSGTVIIKVRHHDSGISGEVEIPAENLLDFVASYVRDQKIAALENADTKELLGL